MYRINLEDREIEYEGEWLSVEKLKERIHERMEAGNMKFAGLASALETLNSALENTHALKFKIVLSKDDYTRLKALGQGDDRECVRNAVMAFIYPEGIPASAPPKPEQEGGGAEKSPKSFKIKCASCQAPIEVTVEQENREIVCANCGARGLLKSRQKGQIGS